MCVLSVTCFRRFDRLSVTLQKVSWSTTSRIILIAQIKRMMRFFQKPFPLLWLGLVLWIRLGIGLGFGVGICVS